MELIKPATIVKYMTFDINYSITAYKFYKGMPNAFWNLYLKSI